MILLSDDSLRKTVKINALVKMVQEDIRGAPQDCRRELSYQEALRILMIEFKTESYYFTKRVREYFKLVNL